jgi:hypothetical protein
VKFNLSSCTKHKLWQKAIFLIYIYSRAEKIQELAVFRSLVRVLLVSVKYCTHVPSYITVNSVAP